MSKKKNADDIYYPVPEDFNPIRAQGISENRDLLKRIVQSTVRIAYSIRSPELCDYHGNAVKPKALATTEQIETVMHLIESIQPMDAIEAALASQFAVTFIRAMEATSNYGSVSINLDLFEFGHKVLEVLQKYRSRGAQQISVQYNVNQGQVLNIKNVKKDEQSIPAEESRS